MATMFLVLPTPSKSAEWPEKYMLWSERVPLRTGCQGAQ